ncbi:AAA family ATPase [Sulfitobacter faviae]|uniref:AAA family ATPase n=1 Tax=Sulfitobacter faviae TaxID=1775881 RepID=UPI00398CF538
MQRRVLIFGASTVGKTSICKEITRLRPKLDYISASSILHRLRHDYPRTCRFNQSEMQFHLCAAIARVCDTRPDIDFLIDGHLYMAKSSAIVPKAAIKRLRPTMLLRVHVSPALISERRRALGRPRYSLQECMKDIENEEHAGEVLSKALQVPLETISPPLVSSVEDILYRLPPEI